MGKAIRIVGMAVFSWTAIAHGAITWDVDYEGDTLPNAASPAWTHANAGGTSAVNSGILTVTSGSPTAANNSWDRTNDTDLTGASSTFLYNSPDVAGATFATVTGKAFTVEWRMKINGPATMAPSDQSGLKLDLTLGVGGQSYTFYYDAANQRLANTTQGWGSHEGRTGPEGAEVPILNDGFANIAIGEWHTYKLTAAVISGALVRELWLDGNYVGRWWTDTGTSSKDIKMRTNTTATPNASIDYDFVRYSSQPDGRYIQALPEPTTMMLLAAGLLVCARRRHA